MTVPSIVTACGDPGGAAALAPVLEALARDGCAHLDNYVYRQAAAVHGRLGLAATEIPAAADQAWIDAVFERARPSLALVATSVNELCFEKRFVAAAQRRGIPSLAVLDFWTNYGARFADEHGRLVYVPTRIAAMDDEARQGLLAAGIAPERVVVTGQPAFDALAERRASFSDGDRERARAALGVDAADRLVLFASQPLLRLYGPATGSGHLGYDESTVLERLVPVLERFALRSGRALTLLVRPHPRESPADYASLTSRIMRIAVSQEGDSRDLAMAADLVIGMTSVLLVEAVLLGCSVVSLQPGRRSADPLPRLGGALARVYAEGDFEPVVEKALRGELTASAAPSIGAAQSAVPAVVRCILSMV